MSTIGQISIERLAAADCAILAEAFASQDWKKSREQFERYLHEQSAQTRLILVAHLQIELAGYLTIMWDSDYLPFKTSSIPEISDFNVLKKFQRRGVGSCLMDAAESLIAERSDFVGIRVGLTADYSPAHRLYIKRGYLPDDNGISYKGESLKYGDRVVVDDDLTIGFIKKVQREKN
jgi:GNAT superfamily N-acetyltransferase